MRSIHSLTRAVALAPPLSLLPTLASAQQSRAHRPGFRLAELPAGVGGARAEHVRGRKG